VPRALWSDPTARSDLVERKIAEMCTDLIPMWSSLSRATAPFPRRDAVRAAELSAEVSGIEHPHAPSDFRDRQLGVRQQAAGFGHAPLNDPLLHSATGAATHDGRQMARRQTEFTRDVAQRQRLTEVPALNETRREC